MAEKPKEVLTCSTCGSSLDRPPEGRPPRYCSIGCRRAAEYERRRVDRHLARLEQRRMELKPRAESYPPAAERLENVERNIAELRERLRELLDES